MFDHRSEDSGPSPRSEPDFFYQESMVDAASLERFHADHGTRRAIEALFDHPERYSFDRIKAFAEFLRGEQFAPNFPGPVKVEYLFVVDPKAVPTASGAISLGHVFTLLRSHYDPDIIVRAGLHPSFVQLQSHAALTADMAELDIGGRKLLDWPIRVPVGSSVEVHRDVLDTRWCEMRDEEAPGSVRFESTRKVMLGTTKSLGVFNLPGRILMLDRRPNAASELQQMTGRWLDELGAYSDGFHVLASFQRVPGIVRDQAVVVRNDGDVSFFLQFSPVSKKR